MIADEWLIWWLNDKAQPLSDKASAIEDLLWSLDLTARPDGDLLALVAAHAEGKARFGRIVTLPALSAAAA